jgi:hypothetical protein
MSEDRNLQATLGVKDADKTASELRKVADGVRDVASSLLEASDAAKTADSSFDSFGAERLLQGNLGRQQQLEPEPQPPEPSPKGKGGLGKAQQGVGALTRATTLLGGEAGQAAGEVAGAVSGIANLVSTLGSAGPAGLAAAAALTAVAIAAGKVNDAAEERADSLARAVDADRELQQQIISGTLTTEQAIKEIDELNALRDDELERQGKLVDGQKRVNKVIDDATGPFAGLVKAGGKALGLTDDIDQLNEEVDKSSGIVKDYDARIEELTEAMEEGALAANDAAEALMDEADMAGELTRFRQQAMEADSEGLAQMKKNLDNERAAKQAELDVLQTSAQQTEETKERIAELNKEMEGLDQKAAVLNESEVQLSAQRKDSAEQTDKLTDSESDLSKEREKVAQAESKARNELIQGMMDLATEEAKAAHELGKAHKEARNEIKEFDDAQKDSRLQSELDHQERMNQIREDAMDAADKMADNFDFLGAARKPSNARLILLPWMT